MVEVDVSTLSIAVGTVLPILVGLVTKEVTDRGVKAVLLALFSAATGAINIAINEGGVFTKETIISAALAWITAVATYYGLLKPSGVATKVNGKTSNFGI